MASRSKSHDERKGRERHGEENAPDTGTEGDTGNVRSASSGPMTLTSPSFAHGDTIPTNHTADGADLAPALAWDDAPPGTKSLALIVEDPDAPDPIAPQRTFTHWIVYNLQASSGGLPLAADRSGLPSGAVIGRNDFGKLGYSGPKPPIGRHRYIFRLFALDVMLPKDLGALDRGALFAAIRGHILAEAELMGTYERAHARSQPISAV